MYAGTSFFPVSRQSFYGMRVAKLELRNACQFTHLRLFFNGGCSPISYNTSRRLTNPSLFNRKVSIVARPIAVQCALLKMVLLQNALDSGNIHNNPLRVLW